MADEPPEFLRGLPVLFFHEDLKEKRKRVEGSHAHRFRASTHRSTTVMLLMLIVVAGLGYVGYRIMAQGQQALSAITGND